MRRIGYGWVAGVGIAGLLVAAPAFAQSGSAGSSSSDQQGTGSSYGTGSTGSSQTGQTGTMGNEPGSTGSQTGTMGNEPGSTGSQTGTMGGSTGTTGQGSTYGTPGGTSAESSTMGSSAANEVTGTVEKFDRKNNTLTLSGTDKKIQVSENTPVMKNGQEMSLSDIKEGDEVRASYSGSGNMVQATRIEVMSTGAAGTTTGKHMKHKKSKSSKTGTSGATGAPSTGSTEPGATPPPSEPGATPPSEPGTTGGATPPSR